MNNKNVWTAVFNVRKEIKTIIKDGDNPAMRSKYATVKGIMDELQPLFEKHNLLFSSEFGTMNDQPGVISHLLWLGGENIESIDIFFPIKEVADSQRMGAAMTYARRYNLGALFNLTFEEDDDTGDSVVPAKATMKVAPTKLNF